MHEISIFILILLHEGSSSLEAKGSLGTDEKLADLSNGPYKFISLFTKARPEIWFSDFKRTKNVLRHIFHNSRAGRVLMNWSHI